MRKKLDRITRHNVDSQAWRPPFRTQPSEPASANWPAYSLLHVPVHGGVGTDPANREFDPSSPLAETIALAGDNARYVPLLHQDQIGLVNLAERRAVAQQLLSSLAQALTALDNGLRGSATQDWGLFLWGSGSGQGSTATKASKSTRYFSNNPLDATTIIDLMNAMVLSVTPSNQMFTTIDDLRSDPARVLFELMQKLEEIVDALGKDARNMSGESQKNTDQIAEMVISTVPDLIRFAQESTRRIDAKKNESQTLERDETAETSSQADPVVEVLQHEQPPGPSSYPVVWRKYVHRSGRVSYQKSQTGNLLLFDYVTEKTCPEVRFLDWVKIK